MTTPVSLLEALDGTAVRQVFATAAAHLRECAAAIDAINVYPVPDGDTGTNMSSTMREAIAHAHALGAEPSVAEVLGATAKGALYGARGNSGVILSQALRGFAAGVGDRAALDGAAVAAGLEKAAVQAYHAVSKPQEGTMLTVLRMAGAAAVDAAAGLPRGARGTGCAFVLGAAVRAAEEAEAVTIDQLPSLKEAGVTDAGGEGICALLRGQLAAITGNRAPIPARPAEHPIALGGGHGGDTFGFCTEFIIEPAPGPLDPDAVRAFAEAGGNRSVVVVGDEELVRVHAHTLEPEHLVATAARFGRIGRVKVDDMSAQHVRFRAKGSGAGARVAVLAMSRGDGIDAIFESLGAAVSGLGLVEKPPAGQIADAADALGIADVIVLPNHANVLLAAEQAKQLARCTLHVVPTTSLPQGIAAAMAFDGEERAQANVGAMQSAARRVTTVEVTLAGASRTVDGVEVREGEAIALIEGKLKVCTPGIADALLAGIGAAGVSRGQLVTVYTGEGVAEDAGAAVARELRERHPGVDIEVVAGGQPLYAFIASVE